MFHLLHAAIVTFAININMVIINIIIKINTIIKTVTVNVIIIMIH